MQDLSETGNAMAVMIHNRRTVKASHERATWPLWPLHTALTVLLLGPVIAPLFLATGLPLLSDAGWLARDLLSTYICPTPARSYLLLGLPMAVCARCWGATIGLWLARGLFTSGARSPGFAHQHADHFWFSRLLSHVSWPMRLFLCALPFLLWPLEIVGAARGWWFAPLWLLLLNGAQAGFAAGLFICSIWPGLRARTVFSRQ